MPCNMMDGVDWGVHASNQVSDLKKVVERIVDELNQLTAIMCEQCRAMEAVGAEPQGQLKVWWDKHKAHDAAHGRGL